MNKLIFILLIIITHSAQADVFKCLLPGGKTAYQPGPCHAAVAEEKLLIKKLDPRKEAEAQARLAAWQSQQHAYEAARIAARKEVQAETDRRDAVYALQQSAYAQQQQVYQLQREADALEVRNRIRLFGVGGTLISPVHITN